MSMAALALNYCVSLDELLKGIAVAPALRVDDIACDSRAVREGTLFIATQGMTHHGMDFLADVISKGAIAVVFDSTTAEPPAADCAIPCIPVAGLARDVGEIANRFFDYPSRTLKVVGVTGTNGKSTVAWLLAACLGMLGARAAYSGTLGYGTGTLKVDTDMTSPDVVQNHRRLAEFRDQGAEFAAIEVSSHALDQGRINGTEFSGAIFTNLSRDHLDYHGEMRSYGEAKARLFSAFPVKQSVINIDSEFGRELGRRHIDNTTLVSTTSDCSEFASAFVFARSIRASEHGSIVAFDSSWGNASCSLPLPGRFNVANAACALGYLLNQGYALDACCAALAKVTAPPGRMQRVAGFSGPAVYVDYAHTPDALEVALTALRDHCRGELWCVFGCGGDRDAGKRPLMGNTADRLADHVILTNDNPRSEPPAAIIADIAEGVEQHDAKRIEDRSSAIAWAISNAAADDVILIAGKGHENYQLIGSERREFSDVNTAALRLAARGTRA
ncbi:MAG TPA: UDP-N-acetylmuramoyl-L-alanyl-D-glutamate--2,6-diaminopimelate ligase [Woeseiaceae bacterium]|nr:UDP-N-acetylmuramoyl-L-alanyl-D-glutamate--2,6-diaminopimelate ligase [Woeseiaceae bacterium]